MHTDCRATRAAAVLAQGIIFASLITLTLRVPSSGKKSIHSQVWIFNMSSANATPTNPLLRRVQGSTRATDLATARSNLRTVSVGGRPAAGAASRTASPRGARGACGPRVSSQSGDDYGSGARDRSREREPSRFRPAGPELAMDWAQDIEKLENSVETLERNTRSYPVAIADQNGKLSNLMNTVQLMNADIDTMKGRVESENARVIHL